MSKSDNDYRTYILAKLPKTEKLDEIQRLGGRIYSKTVSLVDKVHTEKGFWLSKGAVKKYLKFKEYPCQAHSVQAIIDDYYAGLSSFFERVKKDPNSKPPYKTRKFHTFTWRATGISYKNGKLRLSMGKGREPIWLSVDKKFQKKVPVEISLVYDRNMASYEFHATYQTVSYKGQAKQGKACAIDLGEIHPFVTFDGVTAHIYNGRFHRSISQYRNKFLASINRSLSQCRRYSRHWKRLKRVKNRTLEKLNNQVRDIRHKLTSRFVSTCRVAKVQTIVIGTLKHIRQSVNYGKKSNQKIHQWPFSQIADMITYKAKAVGIHIAEESEEYTSQTCPSCGHRKKPSRRTYSCNQCQWQGHRDVVGASNLLTKYQGLLFNPVVGAVVSPTGVRFQPHLRRLDKWSPFRGLKSSKPSKRRQRSTRL